MYIVKIKYILIFPTLFKITPVKCYSLKLLDADKVERI